MQINDFGENSDWENLVALSDEELEIALAQQKSDSQVKTSKLDKDINSFELKVEPKDILNSNSQSNLQSNGGFNSNQIVSNWDCLVEADSNKSSVAEFPDWEQINGNETRSPGFQDWETTNDDAYNSDRDRLSSNVSEISSESSQLNSELNKELINNAMTEGWEKASDEVNTEFMLEWEKSAATISNQIDLELPSINTEDTEFPDWDREIADSNSEISWEVSSPQPDLVFTESWEKASDEVNTEFMKEWEESAARISALTGIDLSEGDSIENLSTEKSEVNGFNPAQIRNLESKPEVIESAKQLDRLPPRMSDESGPLPPLPVLQPKKSHSKKSSNTAPDWFEKYHDRSQDSLGEIPDSIPPASDSAYHFDRLAAEICESDQFSWTSLNQKVQSQPVPRVWNPEGKIVIDLGEEEQVESTAVWNYNPPESFTEAEAKNTELEKPRLDLKPAIGQLWQKFKIPIAAIAFIGGLFAVYSIPFVNRAVTETGLKSQLLKDASYKDLAGIDFQEAKLEKVNFSNASLKNANLKKANLSGANLNGANLIGANLIGANLRAVDLKNSKIELKGNQATKLNQSDLLMWRIINQPLAGRNLSRQNLDGFFLSTANLRKANLSEAKLSWVNFVNADLEGANLAGADLTGTNFAGANLKGVDLNGIKWAKFEPKTSATTTCGNGKQGPCKF